MEFDLFSNLFKYTSTEKNTPLENYLTELFAYILRMLIYKRSDILIELFNEVFHIPFTSSDFENISIETQLRYWVEKYELYAQPDLKITINNSEVYFIENKIESDLNQYENIDQIQLYEAIKLGIPEKNMGVRTLTKYDITTKSMKIQPEHKVFWRQIYTLFSRKLKDDILIQNYLCFLEEHGMGEKQRLVLSDQGLQGYYDFYNFLHDILYNYFHSYNYNDVSLFSNEDYLGFSVRYKKINCLWIGCYREEPQYIVVESFVEDNSRLLKQLTKKKIKYLNQGVSAYGNPVFAKIAIKTILEKKSFEEQEKLIKD